MDEDMVDTGIDGEVHACTCTCTLYMYMNNIRDNKQGNTTTPEKTQKMSFLIQTSLHVDLCCFLPLSLRACVCVCCVLCVVCVCVCVFAGV